jgi:glycerophosphoryl diester phosphodiesterase
MAVLRIGHGGASAVVRGNTLESFDAALEIGVDMIEFDVRAQRGRLMVAHTKFHGAFLPCPTLERALDHLSASRFSDVELNLDLKNAACVAPTLDALDRFGLKQRSLLSSRCVSVVDRVREVDPSVPTAISVGGRVSRAVQRWGAWRDGVLDALHRGRFDALMAYHGLVDSALVEAAQERGAHVYAWTVDDRRRIQRLSELGVRGIATNDPRLFVTV